MVTLVPTVPCLCQTCPQFLIPSGFRSWTGCLRRRAGRAGPWVLHYCGWCLRPLSCWVNRWGPREMRKCSWSRWGDFWSLDLVTRGQRVRKVRERYLFHCHKKTVQSYVKTRKLGQSGALAEALLPVKSKCSVCFYWSLTLILQFTRRRKRN